MKSEREGSVVMTKSEDKNTKSQHKCQRVRTNKNEHDSILESDQIAENVSKCDEQIKGSFVENLKVKHLGLDYDEVSTGPLVVFDWVLLFHSAHHD